MKVVLKIETGGERRDVEVTDELSIGRTELARLVLDDTGLSRLNTTVFIDGSDVLLADEGSTNGTFLNGNRISGRPSLLKDGDEVRLGSYTKFRVQIGDKDPQAADGLPVSQDAVSTPAAAALPAASSQVKSASAFSGMNLLLVAAGLMTFLIIAGGVVAYILVKRSEQSSGRTEGPVVPQSALASGIPVRVIDPLGGEDEDDLDDLIASWETAEKEIDASTVADINVSGGDAEEKELNVTAAFLADRQKKAFEARPGEKGVRPAGLDVPKELFGDGVIKQKAKLRMMSTGGYKQPMDFAELAEKKMKRELIEMPMATESFYLDVGGSAQDKPFSSFSFQDGVADIPANSPKYKALSDLATNFSGQKYDLNNPSDRKQMRMRLLRMFNPRAKPILKELAGAYFEKFGRPLRVTSLTRSMDYQILLNSNNPNSFKVRGEGSLPPHTSGCAFDLSRQYMPVDEQNFVMKKLAEMENAGKLDALIEYGVNACFHIFIYDDGNPPKV